MNYTTMRRALCAGAALACISQAAHAQTRDFDVSAQSAVTAVPLFARQAGVQILAPTDQLAGVRTAALKGAYERTQALKMLLKGTPLVVASDDGATVVLKIAPKPKKADAVAEEASPADVAPTEVVVRGYRQSLISASEVKRRAVGVEDVINADDIAGFPDLNLAEALQRIPGVVITRDAGEGRQIALRGLGPDFTRTQLNGMEVLSNTASGMDNRGGVSRTRAFDYSMFASELFDRVTVQKSYAAEQDEGGIGGTVALSTAKPFDYPGPEMVLSAKGQDNSNASGVTPRVVGLLSDRWGAFGALASVAYSENKSNEYGYRNYTWNQIKANAANIGPGVSAADAALLESGTIFAPQADTLSTWFTDRKRLGITGSLQYHPDDGRLTVDLDSLYGKLTNDRSDYALAASGTNSLTGNLTGTQMILSDVIRGNSLVAADYTGVDLRSEHNVENDTTNFYQTVLRAAYKITDKLTFRVTGGYSRSVYSLPVFAKTYLESKGHSIDVNDLSDSPHNTYDTVTDPNAWNLMRADAQQNGIISQYKTGKGDLIYRFDNGSALKFGAMYKDFSNTGWQSYYKQFYNPGNVDTVIPNSYKGLFPQDSYQPYVVGDVYSLYNYIGKSISLTSAYNQPGSNYQVGEKTVSAYGQYDIDTRLFGYVTRANFGVRYYSTDLTSSGTQSLTIAGVASLAPVTAKNTYHDFLPAANVAINLTDNLLVRFSADRNVSRPALSDLAAAATVNNSAVGGSISAGNPNLKPMTANSAEASVEYYFGKSGYLSAGIFYKNMESFVVSQSSTVTYGSTGYPLSYLLPGQDGSILYSYTRPINSKGADIAGVELAVQHDLNFLPAPFDGFGVNINMTYADGYQDNSYTAGGVTSVVTVPLYNLSKYSVNSTLYYATRQWDARVSLAYRSDYLINAGSNGNIGEGMGATTNIDFAAHYNLGNHITLVVEGINLTNQAITQWADIHVKRPEVYTTAGRTFTFGASYRF